MKYFILFILTLYRETSENISNIRFFKREVFSKLKSVYHNTSWSLKKCSFLHNGSVRRFQLALMVDLGMSKLSCIFLSSPGDSHKM